MTTQPRCSSHYVYWWKTIGKSFVLLRRNGILGRFFEAVPQHPGTNSQTVCPPSMTTSISKMRRKVRWDSVETFFSSENHRKSFLAYGSCCCVGLFVSWVILHLGPINPSTGNRSFHEFVLGFAFTRGQLRGTFSKMYKEPWSFRMTNPWHVLVSWINTLVIL